MPSPVERDRATNCSAIAVEIGPKKTPRRQQSTICTAAKLPKDGLSCSQLKSGYTRTKYRESAAIMIGLRPIKSDSKPESGVITIMQVRLIAWAMKAESNGKCSCTRAKVGM